MFLLSSSLFLFLFYFTTVRLRRRSPRNNNLKKGDLLPPNRHNHQSLYNMVCACIQAWQVWFSVKVVNYSAKYLPDFYFSPFFHSLDYHIHIILSYRFSFGTVLLLLVLEAVCIAWHDGFHRAFVYISSLVCTAHFFPETLNVFDTDTTW